MPDELLSWLAWRVGLIWPAGWLAWLARVAGWHGWPAALAWLTRVIWKPSTKVVGRYGKLSKRPYYAKGPPCNYKRLLRLTS